MYIHPGGGIAKLRPRNFNYGWIIVLISTILFFNHGSVVYSYSVFFKPLAESFGWSRSATSLAFSLSFALQGAFAILMGWGADRFGPRKTILFCGFMTGLGLTLVSRVTELWQLYLIYSLILSLGSSGANVVLTTTTAKWFTKIRGLALGIVSTGLGLGISVGVPIITDMIYSVGWSRAYINLGLAAGSIMIVSALFLRSPNVETISLNKAKPRGLSIHPPALRKPLVTIVLIYSLFMFSLQMIMVHLVNYATDIGFSPTTGATIVSAIGISSIAGRLLMGSASDKIGNATAMAICCAAVAVSLVLLITGQQLGLLYIFAVIFGVGYGGEIPQIAPAVGSFYGFQSSASLVGLVVCGGNIGGALGAWAAGYIFDLSQSYFVAFSLAAASVSCALALSLALRKQLRDFRELSRLTSVVS